MMNFKKIVSLISLFVVIPTLNSCGNKNLSGKYSFTMGKETGTHFSISFNLTNEEFEEADKENLQERDDKNEYRKASMDFNIKSKSKTATINFLVPTSKESGFPVISYSSEKISVLKGTEWGNIKKPDVYYNGEKDKPKKEGQDYKWYFYTDTKGEEIKDSYLIESATYVCAYPINQVSYENKIKESKNSFNDNVDLEFEYNSYEIYVPNTKTVNATVKNFTSSTTIAWGSQDDTILKVKPGKAISTDGKTTCEITAVSKGKTNIIAMVMEKGETKKTVLCPVEVRESEYDDIKIHLDGGYYTEVNKHGDNRFMFRIDSFNAQLAEHSSIDDETGYLIVSILKAFLSGAEDEKECLLGRRVYLSKIFFYSYFVGDKLRITLPVSIPILNPKVDLQDSDFWKQICWMTRQDAEGNQLYEDGIWPDKNNTEYSYSLLTSVISLFEEPVLEGHREPEYCFNTVDIDLTKETK